MLRKLLGAAAAALCLTTAAQADPIPVNVLSNYLNGIRTATSEFQQVSANGRVDTGTFYMQRPYRMRFEYATQPTLILASGGNVAVFDGKSNSGAQQYPMSQTPLSLILAPNVDLSKQGAIVGHGEVNGHTIVTVRDPSGKTPGTVELNFAPGPVLKQWVTTDEMGDRTTVILRNLRTGVELRPSAFSIPNEIERRKGGSSR